jgi:hypothetical protein
VFKRYGGGSLTAGGSLIGGGFDGSSTGGGIGALAGGDGGSFTGDAGSLTGAVSMFLSRCAANISHAFAMTSRERLLSGSLNVLTRSRHFSALRRYRSINSVTRPSPITH